MEQELNEKNKKIIELESTQSFYIMFKEEFEIYRKRSENKLRAYEAILKMYLKWKLGFKIQMIETNVKKYISE